MYDADTCSFYLNETSSTPQRLSILSLEIIDSDSITVFDLTDYASKVKFYGDYRPTISELILGWSLTSQIILNADKYRARYITDTCEIVESSIIEPAKTRGPHED